jgi:ketosteroid isomerase-like protein
MRAAHRFGGFRRAPRAEFSMFADGPSSPAAPPWSRAPKKAGNYQASSGQREPAMANADDDLAIRNLAAAYTDAVNRRDGLAMAAVYAEDGVLENLGGGFTLAGIEKLRRAFSRLVDRDRDYLFQMTHSGLVEIDGDRAKARWWFSELKKPAGGPYEYVQGVYQDQLTRTPAGWRFSRRTVSGLLRWELPGEITLSELPPFLAIAAVGETAPARGRL